MTFPWARHSDWKVTHHVVPKREQLSLPNDICQHLVKNWQACAGILWYLVHLVHSND